MTVFGPDVLGSTLAGGQDTTAGEIAATEALTVDATDDLATVCGLLADHACTHVIVVERDRPVGVVSTLDLVSAFAG